MTTTTLIGHIAAIQHYPASTKTPAALIVVIEVGRDATAWQLKAGHPTYNHAATLHPNDEVLITHTGTNHTPGNLTTITNDPITINHHRHHPHQPINTIHYDPYTPPDKPT